MLVFMSRQEILDFQARWMKPAGIVAIVAAALLVASGVIGSVGSADTTADQLELYRDHAGRLELAAVISGLGLLLTAFPLYFLFRSARARAERMHSFAGPLIVVGAVMVAIQSVFFSLGLKNASDDYVAGLAAVEAKARQAPPLQPANSANTRPKGATTAGGATTGATTAGTTTQAKIVEQRVSDAREDFADDKVNDSSKVRAARIIGLLGGLTLIAGTVYSLVWSIRTGLLTRFMGTIGMVFIAALLLIPQLGPFGMILWFAVLGLMLAGWWIRRLPPAWATGQAIPWPRPGEEPGAPPGGGPPGTVEGSGREVSETPLPENGASAEPPAQTQGRRRKKRKRRN
jgi:hypothetical protein